MTATMHQFKLPDLGEGVHEGQIIRIHVAEGQEISEDDPLIEVETDKAAVEIPSPRSGRVARLHVTEKQLVHVGDVLVTFGQEQPAARASEPSPIRTSREVSSPAATTTPPAGRRRRASPSVRRLAREAGVDLEAVTGTGPAGRITRLDVEGAGSQAPDSATVVAATPDAPAPTAMAPPAARAMAVAGTTPETAIEGVRGTDQYGAIVRQDLSQARRAISRVMQESWQTIPHVTDCNDADITDLEAMRRSFVDTDRPDRRITTLAFIIRAICRSLHRYPILNATLDLDAGDIIFREYMNIAIGVETERGLIAPVIRNAHMMGVGEIADHLDVITHNTRSGAFGVEDTRGATYTVSNAGAMGRTRYSTPIITPGTVACLAVGRARKMPWVVDDQIVPRLILPLSHSMDHRLVDGGREIPFIGHLIDDLEHPMRFTL